jgi:release factor glutamine methyltransferase
MKSSITIKQALQSASKLLSNVTPRAMFEAQILLMHHLGVDRVYLISKDDEIVDDIDGYMHMIKQRANHKPIEYITNKVSFYDIELYVQEGVLIPRPETELLIDKCAEIIKRNDISCIAEIGVGSGAISIVLARKFPHLQIIATDISQDALKIAQKNIDAFNLSNQIKLMHCSLLDCIKCDVDLVVSNPPYIAKSIKLEPNVYDYEPHTALFGGEVGDELLKDIVIQTKDRGIRWLCCEMGYDQKKPMFEFINQNGVYCVEFYKDLAGLDRGFVIDFKGTK